MIDWKIKAEDLARRVHTGQRDKAGEPYVTHCERVAQRVQRDGRCSQDDCNGFGEIVDWDSVGCGDPACCSPASRPCPDCEAAVAVAWLHDVVEDHPDMQEEVFRTFPHEIVMAVIDLDRTMSDPAEYYAIIKSNPLALRVKLADIADNLDELRLARLDDSTAKRLRIKYAKALAALQ